jgi:hypothetical protein
LTEGFSALDIAGLSERADRVRGTQIAMKRAPHGIRERLKEDIRTLHLTALLSSGYGPERRSGDMRTDD